jgi:hypothetical protein
VNESLQTNAVEKRGLLISKRWVQAVAIVMLFGFFVLGYSLTEPTPISRPFPAK